MMKQKIIKKFASILSTGFLLIANTFAAEDIMRLKAAYPDYIQTINDDCVTWKDGTIMPINEGKPNKTPQEKLDAPALIDQLNQVYYANGIPDNASEFNPLDDPGRIRYEPFFRKMYGATKEAVANNLNVIYWLPKYFGSRFPLLVTTINQVDEKLCDISAELSALVDAHPDYLPFLDNPGGTFEWRVIANTNRLSPHSFGMTIDINSSLTNYWQWDLQKAGIPISENAALTYHNDLPWQIVAVFEKYGFIWGGKWHHYDTMHFEYRPELKI